jgi:flagellar motor switch protein FliN/FliY
MTNMLALTPGTPLHTLLDAMRYETGEVLSKAFGAGWAVQMDNIVPESAPKSLGLCFQVLCTGCLQGDIFIQFTLSDALFLAQTCLSEPVGKSGELTEQRKEAVEQLLQRVTSRSAAKLKEFFGEVTMKVATVSSPAVSQTATVSLLVSRGSSEKLVLTLSLSSDLLSSISACSTVRGPVSDRERTGALPEPNSHLLHGVNLDVTLRFGQRVLLLRDILQLYAGAVIELNREIQEPAELLLGDRVIAKGQVVVVDGNYGLRITEVTEPQQRLGVPLTQ